MKWLRGLFRWWRYRKAVSSGASVLIINEGVKYLKLTTQGGGSGRSGSVIIDTSPSDVAPKPEMVTVHNHPNPGVMGGPAGAGNRRVRGEGPSESLPRATGGAAGPSVIVTAAAFKGDGFNSRNDKVGRIPLIELKEIHKDLSLGISEKQQWMIRSAHAKLSALITAIEDKKE